MRAVDFLYNIRGKYLPLLESRRDTINQGSCFSFFPDVFASLS